MVEHFVPDGQQEAAATSKALSTEVKTIVRLPPHFTEAHFAALSRDEVLQELLAMPRRV